MARRLPLHERMETHLAMSGSGGQAKQRRRPARATDDRAERLRERYRLTPSETRVAMLIADGYTVKEIATALGVSVFTVRAHLRAIFAKTGTDRQASLVRVVLTATRVRHPKQS